MAYLYTDDLLTKDEKSYSYAQLAALKSAADAGDAAAAVRLAQLPPGEQRLAGMLVKSFGGKKARKPKVAKGRKKVSPGLRDALQAANEVLRLAERESCNPAIREWARMAAARE